LLGWRRLGVGFFFRSFGGGGVLFFFFALEVNSTSTLRGCLKK
jgi:hypothetical protein